MPLPGTAAMLLVFDIEHDAVAEHDRWHTQEHLTERLSIPGFLRGTRWFSDEGSVRHYMVLYEVANIGVLTSRAYLARLNDPTPWTQEIMPHYRGMRRGLCEVLGSFGAGMGAYAGLVRFVPTGPGIARLSDWLLGAVLPGAPTMAGLGSVHLLKGAERAEMTSEQRIRGADRGVDMALVVTGYDKAAVEEFVNELCGDPALVKRGATSIACEVFRYSYSLAKADLDT